MKRDILYFSEFVALNEAKSTPKKPKVKVIMLSNLSEESYTIPAIEAECKKRGIDCRAIDINTVTITPDKKMKYDFLISDGKNNKKPFGISVDDTAILTRRGVVSSTYTRDVVTQLEDNGFFVVNTIDSIMSCENKYVTSKLLLDAGIPVPKMAIIENEEKIEAGVKAVGGQFPVVIKLLSGSHGIGVSIVDSYASLRSVLQTIWKLDKSIEILIQEKIDSEYDLRIHVLTKRFNAPVPEETDSVLLGYMRRNRVKKDFRTNYSLGGSVEKTKVTKEQEAIAIEAAKAIGCNWCGVDLIFVKKTGKNYVLEVNSSPGTQGLKKATGIDVVADIVDFITDKANWLRSKKVIGFREVINIPGIGDIVAKFDTGNGSLSSSLTFDELDVSDDKKTVNWELGGKKFTNKIVGFASTEVGDVKDERIIIELDIQFAGKTYKNVYVSLVDRKEKSTKFLVNRKFMERIGCAVSPTKTFIVTSFEGEYAAGDAKGVAHAGINFMTGEKK
jgi:ribosomal protein S6--L-glutamate ligase